MWLHLLTDSFITAPIFLLNKILLDFSGGIRSMRCKGNQHLRATSFTHWNESGWTWMWQHLCQVSVPQRYLKVKNVIYSYKPGYMNTSITRVEGYCSISIFAVCSVQKHYRKKIQNITTTQTSHPVSPVTIQPSPFQAKFANDLSKWFYWFIIKVRGSCVQ